jgi:hypothetical protein
MHATAALSGKKTYCLNKLKYEQKKRLLTIGKEISLKRYQKRYNKDTEGQLPCHHVRG